MSSTTAERNGFVCLNCRTIYEFHRGGKHNETYLAGQGPFCDRCVRNGVTVTVGSGSYSSSVVSSFTRGV